MYPVSRFTTAYVIDAWSASHATVRVGAARSWMWVSDDLRPVYGETPRGVLFFAQLLMH